MYLIKRKNGVYYIQFVDPNTKAKRRISTGTKSKVEALKFCKNFNPNYDEVKNVLKLSRFRDEYLSYLADTKSEKYIKSIKLSFNHLLKDCKDIPLQDLNVRILDHFISKKFSSSPAAAHLYFRTLKAALSKAVSWGYIHENPLKKIKPPKQKKSLPLFISKEEFEQILSHTRNEMLKELFITAFYTGMRLGEIVNLTWESVDSKRNIIVVKNINGFITKSKKERIIPVNSNVKAVMTNKFKFNEGVTITDYIFYRVSGIKLNEDYVSKQFKKAVRKAGLIDSIHFHTLRHSFASRLIQKGASLFVVKELLGHEDIKTTQIYSHLQTKNLEAAIKLL